ncbi:beta-propeller fold lactonase family protein, partial [Bdellovibrionota bacterium FG-1]
SISPDGGALAGGTAMTLTGFGFSSSPLATVTLGGIPCTGVVVNATQTQLTCTSGGPGAGAAGAVVDNGAGGSASAAAAGFTYQAAPTFINVDGVATAKGSTYGGATITIRGANFRTGITATVGGSACTNPTAPAASLGSFTFTCTTPAHAAQGNGAVAADIVVTNSDTQTVTGAGAYTYQSSLFAIEGNTTVLSYLLNTAGNGSLVAGTTAVASSGPAAVAVHPSKSVVYTVNVGTVDNFTFAPNNGDLTNVSTVGGGGGAGSGAAVDPSGKFLYATNLGGTGKIYLFPLNATTGYATAGSVAVTVGSNPMSLSISPNGKWLYVVNNGSSSIQSFTIDQNSGALTEIGSAITTGTTPSCGANPNVVMVSPNSANLYVAYNAAAAKYVQRFSINPSDGSLGAGDQGNLVNIAPTTMAIDPSGSNLFVTSPPSADAGNLYNNQSLITTFAMAAGGGLSGKVDYTLASVFGTYPTPTASVVDPTGGFFLTTNSLLKSIPVFKISAGALPNDGGLAPKTLTPSSDGTPVTGLATIPSGLAFTSK